MKYDPDCVFCRIVVGDEPAEVVREWPSVVAFRPLHPVTEGHTLVVPARHVQDALEDEVTTAQVMLCAADLAEAPCNLIISCGEAATQTVFHLHVHVVPRRPGDGLKLPWSPPDALVARQPPPDQYPYESMGR